VERVSVAPEAIKPIPSPPAEPLDPSAHMLGVQDLTVIDERTIEYRLGVGACDKGINPLTWESPDIIVLGGNVGIPPEGSCTAQLVLHPVKVTLSAALGDRVILDVHGNPVPRTAQ
jgi:hypothetical protein